MKNMKRFIILMLVCCLVPFGSIALADTNALQNQAVNGGIINQNIVFVDVKDHWANNAINDMAQKGFLSGYEDSTFKPEKSISREEFAKLIALTFSISLQNAGTPTYSDVYPDKWSYSYIESTKDFLTGYYPPKGKAFFSPESQATREDVAVALVKVLGYTTNDLKDSKILDRRFRDVGDVSIGLRDYVAIATEKQLISGYEDGTFRPDKPITRAEVATLLYRVIKSSAQDQAQGPQLDVNLPKTTQDGTYYVSGKTQKDAKIYINDKAVELTNGEFKEGYKLDKEGIYDVTIVAKIPSGKTTTVHKQIEYKTSGPILKIDDIPNTVATEKITFSGTVMDVNDPSPKLYLNDEKLYISGYSGEFSKEVTLSAGENTFIFKAKNNKDKETIITKKITFNEDAPILKISSIPDATVLNKITVSGTVTDKNDSSPKVYLNDKQLYVDYSGQFSSDVSLEEGNNNLTFKAENKNGKKTTFVKTISFNVGGPDLVINSLPTSTTSKTITISGTVKDKNDSRPVVYINDKNVYVSYDGSFSQDFTLTEGTNSFTIKATNANGKVSTQTKDVTFNVGGPDLVINSLPTSTSSKTITISGTVKDKNDSRPVVYINDKSVYVSYDGSFSQDFTLTEGTNSFTIKATNTNGKVSTQTKDVTFNVGGPVLKLGYYPLRTSQTSITISGSIKDSNDNNPIVYFNDKKLYVDYSGNFNQDLRLNLGANQFTVVGSNSFGKTSTVTGVVYLQ